MLKILENDKDLIAVKFSGKLEDQDYNVLIPLLENKIQVYGNINFYWELENFQGWDPKALWSDLKFNVKHVNHFKRVAVVGDKKWEKIMTELLSPFTNAEVRFFDLTQKDLAWVWAKQHSTVA